MKLKKTAIIFSLAFFAVLMSYSMIRESALVESVGFEEARRAKAKLDLETIRRNIAAYNAAESAECESISALRSKFFKGGRLADPWGRDYEMDATRGTVFSRGPDGAAGDSDDISVKYK